MCWHLQAGSVLVMHVTADQEISSISAVQVWEWEPSDKQHQLKSNKACPKMGKSCPGR